MIKKVTAFIKGALYELFPNIYFLKSDGEFFFFQSKTFEKSIHAHVISDGNFLKKGETQNTKYDA